MYIHTTKNSTEALLVNSKKVGLQANAEKTNYKFMPHEQHIKEIHSVEKHKKLWPNSSISEIAGTKKLRAG
jgi:hypothetical protein